MSGGALEYAFSKVIGIVADIDRIMTTDWFKEYASGAEVEALNVLTDKLDECVDGLHDAEWWLSGDTDSKQLLEWARKHEV